jgi:hypothetical protein
VDNADYDEDDGRVNINIHQWSNQLPEILALSFEYEKAVSKDQTAGDAATTTTECSPSVKYSDAKILNLTVSNL